MTYRVERQHEGVFHVLDNDGDRIARVSSFLPGPAINLASAGILSPRAARAVAEALVALADEMEA